MEALAFITCATLNKPDKIKIDRSFIYAVASERATAGIVSALVGLGHGLGLTIAADGIEGGDQETSLITSGCEEGQGNLFSAPICGADTLRLFTSENTTSLRLLGRK